MGPPGRIGLMAGKHTWACFERSTGVGQLKSPVLPSAVWPLAKCGCEECGHCLPTVTLPKRARTTTAAGATANGGRLAGVALPRTNRKRGLGRTALVFDALSPSPYLTLIPLW